MADRDSTKEIKRCAGLRSCLHEAECCGQNPESAGRTTNRADRRGKIWSVVSAVSLMACGVLAVMGYRSGILSSSDSLQSFIGGLGCMAALVFVVIQIVQVVVPILPGGISCLVGVLAFGPVYGFLYNYIGICIGSMAAFGIAKYLGKPVLYGLFPEKTMAKYESWTQERGRFLKLFALAIFFPVAPDDFLCYLAGTTTMTWRQFTAVIWLAKPASIALYSLGMTGVFRVLLPEW